MSGRDRFYPGWRASRQLASKILLYWLASPYTVLERRSGYRRDFTIVVVGFIFGIGRGDVVLHFADARDVPDGDLDFSFCSLGQPVARPRLAVGTANLDFV